MTRRIMGLLAIFCMLFVACSDKTSVPFGILSLDKMTPVMWDIIEADQYAAILVKDSAHVDAKLERLRLYDEVFRLHGISREKFQKSYAYYKEHPGINQILYDSLAAQGTRYRNEAYAHPGARPAVIPPPVTSPPPAMNPMFHAPGRANIPIIKPFVKPDTSHGKNRHQTPPVLNKSPGSHPSSNPPAKSPAA